MCLVKSHHFGVVWYAGYRYYYHVSTCACLEKKKWARLSCGFEPCKSTLNMEASILPEKDYATSLLLSTGVTLIGRVTLIT